MIPELKIPEQLAESCGKNAERSAWLERLPQTICELQEQWSLSLEPPIDGDEVSCAWVAPATRSDGTRIIFKIGMPHLEGQDEIQGLRFWDGDPTVHLLESADSFNAMLLEPCVPGTVLRHLPEVEQDVIIARLLRRLWRQPPASHPFRPLSVMIAHWTNETTADRARWPDEGLVQEGLLLFDSLSRPSREDVLLATDLHAGNVLQAQREPWLVIDPKPFVGDRAYDATQHLFNCRARMRKDLRGTIHRFADLLEVDAERVRLWMFARSAAEPRDAWGTDTIALARMLA